MARSCMLVALATALAPSAAAAAQILDAAYDARADALAVDIAYRGTHAEHPFEVRWAPCSDGEPPQTLGRLIDLNGSEAAEEDFRTRVLLPLDGLPCRPVQATLRLGRISNATVFIP